MRLHILSFCILLFIAADIQAQDTMQHIIAGRKNSIEQQSKPYVILISADGFRYDLADLYHAKHLIQLRDSGVQAAFMKPSFPSLTFPNHYSIVTGLYPAHHGIVDNIFFDWRKQAMYSLSDRKAVDDSSWYGGEPLWVLAEKNQMLSASYYWVGSEAAIDSVRPTYCFNYNEKISVDERLAGLKRWLQLPPEQRPHLITFYFPEPDHTEHMYGTASKQTEAAVKYIDESMGKMTAIVDSLHLEVNFIFLSDHGMTNVDTVHSIESIPVDTSQFLITRGEAMLHLYAKNVRYIIPTYEALKSSATDYDVYLADSIPRRWVYRKIDDKYKRIGDIILIPHLPEIFNLSKRKVTPGKHGFDNDFPDMRATFYAWGPAFKSHIKIDGFENVNVYPLIAKILSLNGYQPIDGDINALAPILK